MRVRRVLIEKIPLVPTKGAMVSRVSELGHIISECQEEIKRLRESCRHDKYDIGYYSWRIGCMDLKRMCSYCRIPIGEPSPEEQQKYYSEYGNILNRPIIV